jgi:PAS domain S-box-containing protein
MASGTRRFARDRDGDGQAAASSTNADVRMGYWREVDLRFVDRLAVPASLHDVDGRFVHMNPAAERASGLSNAQVLGRHLTEPVLPEGRESVEAQFRRAVEHGEPTDFETAFLDARGHPRSVRAQHLPLRDRDSIVGVLILAFEVRRPPRDPIHLGSDPQLTRRQREIVNLIAAGLSTAEIARELMLSTETVRNHLRNAFRELGVHTRVEAIAAARRLGLLATPGLGPQPPDDGIHEK